MDIELYYEEYGTGEPLVLLHGNNEDSTYFKHQIEYFSKKYRVIAVDTRGHGRSPRGDGDFTLARFSEDLLGFLNSHSIETPNILGFSDGGNIALLFALKHPERVKCLILNGANLYAKGVKPSVQIPTVVEYYAALLAAKWSPKVQRHAAMLGLMVLEPNIKPEELHRLRIKTLVIAGDRDMIKDSHTRLIHKSIPGAKLAILPGDHFIAAKEPDMFNQAVDEFLSESLGESEIRRGAQDES